MVIGKSWTWAALAAIVIAVLGTAGCNNASQDEAKPSLVTHERLDFASNPLGDGAAPDAGPASPSIGAFAAHATEAIEMNGGALVTGCSVGVENTTGPFLGGGAAAYFNSGADPCAYGYECNLNNVCVVNHRCERGYIYCDGSCIVGTGAWP
jgi:hypothetical protein